MKKRPGVAIVRQYLERILAVSRTWFEWSLEEDGWTKILVVEVDFDSDPTSPNFRQEVFNAIKSTANEVLRSETDMVVGGLKIVPMRY